MSPEAGKTHIPKSETATRPFHLVGAPWIDADATVDGLRALHLPGIAFRATRFRPEFGKHARSACAGLELHVTDRDRLEPVSLGLNILKMIHDLHRKDFAWRTEPYEFVSDVPALDLLTGSPDARQCIESGTPFDDLFTRWRAWIAEFEGNLDGILLYHE